MFVASATNPESQLQRSETAGPEVALRWSYESDGLGFP